MNKASLAIIKIFRRDEWGWIVTGILLIIFFIVATLHGSLVQDLFCSPEKENCFREWVSALSGWAAAVAAIATISVITRQIKDAGDHHNENVKIQMMDRLVIARELIEKCEAGTKFCNTLPPRIDELANLDPLEMQQKFRALLREAQDIVAFIASSEMRRFRASRGVGGVTADDIIQFSAKADPLLDSIVGRLISNGPDGPTVKSLFDQLGALTIQLAILMEAHLRKTASSAEKFLIDWDRPLNR